ncbi:MAG: M48 family metalloprotease [Pseudomonadota bacterium]
MNVIRKLGTWICLAILTSAAPAAADGDIRLPDMGSPADAILSRTDEAQLGRQIMASIRASGQVIEDPLINEYINEVGRRIAAHTNDGGHSFTFFVIEDPAINAFALPGGYIGVHTGLIEASRNENELAGVLAHEVAHVTQRHIARAIHASQRQSIVSTALMLGAIIAGVAGAGGEAVEGLVGVAQGTAVQQRINFTRSNEYEADRIGIAALAEAGFDPHGMATFFEVLSRQSPVSLESRVPEFLRTHPVTTTRIAEARSRASKHARVVREDSVGYGISRVRALVSRFDTPEAAVAHFESRDYARQDRTERYGRAVAYQRAGLHRDAKHIFEDLLEDDESVIAFHIGLAQSRIALEERDRGLETWERAVALFPRNVPLIIEYGEDLLTLGQAEKAHELLLDLLNNVPPTPAQVRLIARAASEAGEQAEALYYMSEYHLMTGNLEGGINFLRQALLVPDLGEIQRIRFEARIDFIREFMSEEQLRRMQRNRPSSGVAARNRP